MKSEVWTAFSKKSEKHVRCNWCHKEYAYSGSTTMMRVHLEAEHKQRFATLLKTRNNQSMQNNNNKDDSIRMLALAFSTGNIPFKFVENTVFRRFLKSHLPDFPTVTADTVKNQTVKNANEYVSNLKAILKDQKSISVEVDGWKCESGNFNLYSLFASYIDDQFERVQMLVGVRRIVGKCDAVAVGKAIGELLESVDKTVLEVKCSVSDHGSNIVACFSRNNIMNAHCGAHIISLMFFSVFEMTALQACIKKARDLATLLKRSDTVRETFKSNADDLKVFTPKPKNFSPTRWGGCFLLLKAWSDHARTVLMDPKLQPFVPTASESETLATALSVMKPLYKLLLSHQRNNSFVSEIIPEFIALKHTLLTMKDHLQHPIHKKLLSKLNERLVNAENNKFVLHSVVCDPRYAFVEGIIGTKKWNSVCETFMDFAEEFELVQPNIVPVQPLQSQQSLTPMQLFLISKNASNQNGLTLEMELSQYRAELTTSRPDISTSPLDFWKLRANAYKQLALISKVVLSTRASSSQTERLFSRCSDITNNIKRNRLKPETINSILLNTALESLERQNDDDTDYTSDEYDDDDEDKFRTASVQTTNEDFYMDMETQTDEILDENKDGENNLGNID